MATEQVVEQVIEEVAENFEEAAVATRALDARAIGYFGVGIVVGAAVGFYFGYRWNKEKIKAEVFKQSEEEVAKIRQWYQEREESVRIVEAKPSLDEVVEERGYSTAVVIPERPTRPPVPVYEASELPRRDFTPGGIAKRHVDREKDKNDGWDYGTEVSSRTNQHPYIIHQDEYAQGEEGHEQVTLTYYAVDAVLTDEDESVIDNADEVVGLDNLGNFGHGADDYHVLYIRNDRFELDYEVCLVAASYEETVQGLSNEQTD